MDLQQKRAVARLMFTRMSEAAQASAALKDAEADKARAFAQHLERRLSRVESIPEDELDLLIADWEARGRAEVAREAYARSEDALAVVEASLRAAQEGGVWVLTTEEG